MLGPEEVTSGLINDYTISSLELQEKAGIIPLTIFHIFEQVNAALKENIEFSIKCSYLEIYNESINDLLSDPPVHNLKIREFPHLGMRVIGSTEKSVTSPDDVFACLALGTMNRITGATEMNQRSSRSHTLFVVSVEQKFINGSTKNSRLNLVDLAGSEKVSKTGASGQALKEAQNINLSLTTLGRCIKALSSTKDEHIPFRESKLTMILKEALGGNAKTSLICAVSQKIFHVEEGKSTLKFAERAKKVQTKAKSNVKKSPEELLSIIEQLKTEISALKKQLKGKESLSDSRRSSIQNADDDINVRYAELRAQYDSMAESSQYEIEQLKARVEQLIEPAMRYPLQIQEHLDRIEELNSHLSAVLNDKEALRKSYEGEIVSLRSTFEANTRELEIVNKEMSGAMQLLAKTKDELFEKEQECEQLTQKLSMTEFMLKSDSEKVSKLRETVDMQTLDIDNLHRQRTELQQAITNSVEKEAVMQSDFIRCQNALDQATRDNEQRISQFNAASSTISDLESTVRQLNSRVASQEQTITELIEAARKATLEHQMQLVALNSTIDESKKSTPTKEKSQHAKHMLTRLLKEMSDLQGMYQETQMRFRQEFSKAKEEAEDRERILEKKIESMTVELQNEVKKTGESDKNWKLAMVEVDALRFHMTKMKADIAGLTNELGKEKALRASLSSQLSEANSQLEAFRRLQSTGNFTTDTEMTTAKQNLRTAERKYRVSLDDIQARMLRFTAETSTLSEALTAKEAEIRSHLTRIRELENQATVLRLQAQKDEHKLKMMRLVSFRQKNRSSVAQLSRGRLVSLVTQEVKMGNVSFSSQPPQPHSHSQSSEEDKAQHFTEKTWRLPHRDLYGMQEVQTLYSNDGESDCSVKCKHSGIEDYSEEDSEEAEDVLE